MSTFFIKTFGCQMNKDDSERLAGLLVANGFSPAVNHQSAAIIIFNTCCVRKNADDKLYGQIRAMGGIKKARPETIIAVGGCLAQAEGEELARELEYVDIVFGTHNLARLPLMIENVNAKRTQICDIPEDPDGFNGDLPAVRQNPWQAWLPITVGCDNYCTYCIVPYVRGRERSRPFERLLESTAALLAEGVKEITLLGQNVNSYGRDLYGTPRFASLLKSLSQLPGLERIRFTTSHPKDLTDDVIELVAEGENICPHFHLPLQAGADRVLRKMHRQYTVGQYLELVAKIREKIPEAAITTDLMVGFPGETDTDFADTLAAVKAAEFDQAFTFIYSPRRGTKAAQADDQVPDTVKQERFAQLIEVQNQLSRASHERQVGRVLNVLIDAVSKKPAYRLAGRSLDNKLVHIDGPDELLGRTIQVEVVEAFSWFLIAKRV